MEYKAYIVYAYHKARPQGGDYLLSSHSEQDALDKLKRDWLYTDGSPGWRFQMRCIPAQYGNPVRKYWVE